MSDSFVIQVAFTLVLIPNEVLCQTSDGVDKVDVIKVYS